MAEDKKTLAKQTVKKVQVALKDFPVYIVFCTDGVKTGFGVWNSQKETHEVLMNLIIEYPER